MLAAIFDVRAREESPEDYDLPNSVHEQYIGLMCELKPRLGTACW